MLATQEIIALREEIAAEAKRQFQAQQEVLLALDDRILNALASLQAANTEQVTAGADGTGLQIATNADWANLTNKPLWADLPNERAINNAGPGNPITLTQANVNEGHWHYVNTTSSAVTITLPNGLKVVSGEGRIRCLATFWCVSYSNPVSFVIGSDYTDSTNGGTITAASQVYSLTASQDVGQALPNIKIVPGVFA